MQGLDRRDFCPVEVRFQRPQNPFFTPPLRQGISAGHQDIRGLDVSVNDARAMRRLQSEQNLPKDADGFSDGEPPPVEALL